MNEKKPLYAHIAQAAGISEECAERAIDATLSGFRCLLHREEIQAPGTPTPQISVPGTPTPQISVPGTPTPQISAPGTPTPQVAAAAGAPASKASTPGPDAQYRRHCRPAHRRELVAHIAHEAGISLEAAGHALAAILGQINSIGADAGVKAILEYRP